MFVRRHPILFFILMMVFCFTLTFSSLTLLLGVGIKMLQGSKRTLSEHSEGNVGIVEIHGMILSSKEIIQNIQTFRNDETIKAIVLRIDSPGGGIGPSQEIHREIIKTREAKTVLTSMGSVGASGGYYIAAATEGIMANAGTLTGSIGVIMEYANLMEIARKIGISPVVVKSAEFKDMGSPLKDLGESEKKIFQDLVDELHLQFVTDAAAGRGMTVEDMALLADGRVYTGRKALVLKLIDRIGNLDDAVQWAGELAGIDGKVKPVYPKEDRLTFIRRLAETLFKNINISGSVTDNFRYIIN